MVHDALREMEEKGISPEKPWMDALKEASGSAFLGTLLGWVLREPLLMRVMQPVSCVRDRM